MNCKGKNIPPQMLIHQILRLISMRADEMLDQYQLKRGQAGILMVLERYSRISQKELAELLGVKPPSITVALQKMEKLGYILREPDEKDQRILRIRNTEEGSACVGTIKRVFCEMEDIMYGNMTREEVLLLGRLLRQICDNLMEGQDPARFDCCPHKLQKVCMRKDIFR